MRTRPRYSPGPLLALTILLLVGCRPQASLAQAQATAATGCRLGINLSGPADWGSELPFVDIFKLSRRWISQTPSGQPWGQGPTLQRDAHGWITRLDPGCYADTPMCTIPGGRFPQGQYTCLYDGDGKLEFWGAAKIVAQTPGKIILATTPGQSPIWLRLRETNPNNYLRNIRVIMPGCETSYQKEPFRQGFLDQWRGMDTLRFQEWMKTDYDPPSHWAQRPTPDSCNYTEGGVPVEAMVDLCNRLGANGWFNMPHTADDEYVRQFAAYVRDNLKPGLKAYVEYSNEVWNSQFTQNRYAIDQGKKLGLGEAQRPWEGGGMYYTHRSLEVFRIWEEVFGGRERLVRLLAWQAVAPWWVEHIILPTEEACKHCDAVAIAPYFGPLIATQGTDHSPSAEQVLAWTPDQLLDYVDQVQVPSALEFVRQQKAICDKYGLRLICYEAGQHLIGIGAEQNNDRLTQVLTQANRNPRMGPIYTKYLNGWQGISEDLMCLFCSTNTSSKYGSFGLSEYYDETEADAPKLKAVWEWLRAHPRQ